MFLFFLFFLSIFIFSLYRLYTKEKYKGSYNPKNSKLGRGPYGNPIYGGFISSPWYRRGPYYPYNTPYPYYPSYPAPYPAYSYPYFWYPGGYAGCPLRDGCVSNVYPY